MSKNYKERQNNKWNRISTEKCSKKGQEERMIETE